MNPHRDSSERQVAEAVHRVRAHNAWRRGAQIPMIDPAQLGNALEVLWTYASYCNAQRRPKPAKKKAGEVSPTGQISRSSQGCGRSL